MVIDFAKYPIGQRVVLQNLQPKNNIEFANTDKIERFKELVERRRGATGAWRGEVEGGDVQR